MNMYWTNYNTRLGVWVVQEECVIETNDPRARDRRHRA